MSTGKTVGLINALGGGSGNGGSSLPPVTSSDNGKVLAVEDGEWAAGVQEYLIPLEYSEGALRVPEGKNTEVALAITNPDRYWVRGVKINGVVYAGYVENSSGFIVPLNKIFMEEFAGYNCAGKIRIAEMIGGGFAVTIEPDKFLVTLTPNNLDFSGTMDKTVAEINAAYEAGQEIWFKVLTGATTYVEVPAAFVGRDTTYDYPNFGAEIVQYGTNAMIVAGTGDTSDGTKQTYSTSVYTLTPAS